jgi:hypothetical protein
MPDHQLCSYGLPLGHLLGVISLQQPCLGALEQLIRLRDGAKHHLQLLAHLQHPTGGPAGLATNPDRAGLAEKEPVGVTSLQQPCLGGLATTDLLEVGPKHPLQLVANVPACHREHLRAAC